VATAAKTAPAQILEPLHCVQHLANLGSTSAAPAMETIARHAKRATAGTRLGFTAWVARSKMLESARRAMLPLALLGNISAAVRLAVLEFAWIVNAHPVTTALIALEPTQEPANHVRLASREVNMKPALVRLQATGNVHLVAQDTILPTLICAVLAVTEPILEHSKLARNAQ